LRNYYIFTVALIVYFSALFSTQDCLAEKKLLLNEGQNYFSLDSNYFEKIKWEDIDNYSFLPNNRLFIHNPNTDEAYWYRIKITNNSQNNSEWILVSYFYSIDEIDLIIKNENGQIEKQYYRDTMSVYDRIIQHNQPSFSISIAKGETKTLFIKIKNESTYEYAFGLFTHFSFFSTYLKEYYLIGLFYGFMLFILIYSLINYAFFRDKVILLYILFITSQIVHMLFRDGYGVLIFPTITEYADVLKNLSRASISVFILIYTLLFLNLTRKNLVFYFVVTFILARIVYAIYMMGDTSLITYHFELFAILISTGLSIYAYFKKYIDAKYMVIGLTIMSIAYFTFYLSVVWISSIGNIGYFIMYFGIAAECIFTTLALTERFKRIQIDNYNKNTLTKELEESIAKRTDLIVIQNKVLEEQTSELNAFLYSASHDLSGPIKSLIGLLYLAEKDPDANYKELYSMMSEKLTTLESNISDLNAVSILKNKTIQLAEINFRTIHNDTIKKYAQLIEQNKISISLDLKTNYIFTHDNFSIYTIYNNIVSNAIKFHDTTRPSFLKIIIEKNNDQITLSFIDNGIGIESDKFDKIFKMFYRGNTRSKNDIGIGLYISKLAAQKLGGELEAESSFGIGSKFTVSFSVK